MTNTNVPMSSLQLEQQFQARIAQAKEAARLASIASATRGLHALNKPPLVSSIATPGVPFRPPCALSSGIQVSSTFSDFCPIENVPSEIKARIDRLVEFVARNGDAFEATARQREESNPDFAFLRPGGPFSDYYQWKKQQRCGKGLAGTSFTPLPSMNASSDSCNATTSSFLVPTDPLGTMSVGAMANVCKYAKTSGIQKYAPIPREVILNVGNLPPVEPARLEIRLSEFYRYETSNG